MKGRDDSRLESERRLYREKLRQQRENQNVQAASNVRTSTKRRPAKRSKLNRKPAFIVLSVMLVFFAALITYRLYEIQIVNNTLYAQEAVAQHYRLITENPIRGEILDRNGNELAGTTYVYRIGVTPKDVRSITKIVKKEDIAAKIAECLQLNAAEVLTELEKDSTYIQLKKDVPSDQAIALKAYLKEDDIGGVRIDSEPRRFYTSGTLASQVIGFANYNQSNLIGQLGVEMQYNTILTGEPGYTYVETDNYTMGELPFSVPTSLRAKNGLNVVLNIDVNIQQIAQEELENAITQNNITDGGSVIVMNPYTGAVLAMASYPFFSSSDPTACPAGFDPSTWDANNNETDFDILTEKVWRNRAIADTFEPGSTMKAVTASMALEESLSKESDLMSDAPIEVASWTIRCYKTPNHGLETLQQGFWNSCNPIFAQLARKVGVSRFYDYLQTFGLKAVTGIDLPVEGIGILHQNPTEIDMMTFSYGESSTVTPIQMATAYCVFANGGNLVKPMVVKAITDKEGKIVQETTTQTVRKVLSESTTLRIRELLKGVVLYGTGSAAYIEGYSIGGKTSTSTDDNGVHTLSFIGISPADNPELVVLVVLNKPADNKLTSTVAAKACGQIISRSLEYMGVARIYSNQDVSRLTATTSVPNVAGMTYKDAISKLTALGLKAEAGNSAMGSDTVVHYQYPATDTPLHKAGLVVLYPETAPVEQMVVVPNFSGKNVNECISAAAGVGLNIKIAAGCLGVAVSQDVVPTIDSDGIIVEANRLKRGSIVSISFEASEETNEEEVAQTAETE